MNIKDNLKLYCVYHDKKLETQYIHTKHWFKSYYKPLVESNWFKLYYTKEGHINSIDNLQQYFCEFTALYYIYKNNLYSPYIGVCHYGRQKLRYLIEQNIINDTDIIGEYSCNDNMKHCCEVIYNGFLIKDLLEYIKSHYDKQSRIYNYFIDNYETDVMWLSNICFITKWEYFYEIVGLLVNFFDYINKIKQLDWSFDKYTQFITDEWINKFDFTRCYEPNSNIWYFVSPESNKFRIIAYFIEVIIGFYFGHLNVELSKK